MKNLTPEEKIELLIEVKALLANNEECYICIAIEEVMARKEGRRYVDCYGAIGKYIPELSKYRPVGVDPLDKKGWFDLRESDKRIAIIDKVIDELNGSIRPIGGGL